MQGEGSSKAAQALVMMCTLAAETSVVGPGGLPSGAAAHAVAQVASDAPPAVKPGAAASLEHFVATMPEVRPLLLMRPPLLVTIPECKRLCIYQYRIT